ncbi:MAG: hypothetical protein M1825_003411 [Sarcosagium campestre]|nr:MAG: hypothetical protein M1825_003411 [Sarcosagium campestre]
MTKVECIFASSRMGRPSSRYSTPSDSEASHSEPSSPEPDVRQPTFRFLDLAAETRIRVYQYCLHVDHTIDLDPNNHWRIAPGLNLLLTNRQIHDEAEAIFYRENAFRIFPTHGRFFHTRAPLLKRMGQRLRSQLTVLELRLGPGWSSPPKSWWAKPSLGLQDASQVRLLKVFIECDPSQAVFNTLRHQKSRFLDFAASLLAELLSALPRVGVVEFDKWPSAKRDGPLIAKLAAVVEKSNKILLWKHPLEYYDGEDT